MSDNSSSSAVSFGGGSARNAVISFAGALTAAVLGFILTVVVGRSLGPTGAGVFFSVAAVFFVLSNAVELGADTALTWHLPRLRALGRHADIRTSVQVGLLPVWVASAFSALVMFASAPQIAQVLFTEEHHSQGTVVLRLVAPALLVAAPMTCALAATRGLGSVVPFTAVINVGIPTLRPLLILLVVAVGMAGVSPLVAVTGAWALPVIMGAAAALVLLARALRRVDAHVAHPSPSLMAARDLVEVRQEFWRYARPRGVSALLEIALVWGDVLLVSALAGPREAGIYAAASRFVTTGTLAEAAMRVALSPRISQLLALHRHRQVGQLVATASVWITAISWPLYLTLATFSPLVLHIFGPEFSQGATALSILALAMAVAMAAGNVQTVLLMSGHSRWQMNNKLVALTVDVLGCLVLIPPLGMVGAAWAWAAAIVVDTTLAVYQVRVKLQVRSSDPPATTVRLAARPWAGARGYAGAVRSAWKQAQVEKVSLMKALHRQGAGLGPVAGGAALLFGGFGALMRVVTNASLSGFIVFLAVALPLYAVACWWMRPLFGVEEIFASFVGRFGRPQQSSTAQASSSSEIEPDGQSPDSTDDLPDNEVKGEPGENFSGGAQPNDSETDPQQREPGSEARHIQALPEPELQDKDTVDVDDQHSGHKSGNKSGHKSVQGVNPWPGQAAETAHSVEAAFPELITGECLNDAPGQGGSVGAELRSDSAQPETGHSELLDSQERQRRSQRAASEQPVSVPRWKMIVPGSTREEDDTYLGRSTLWSKKPESSGHSDGGHTEGSTSEGEASGQEITAHHHEGQRRTDGPTRKPR